MHSNHFCFYNDFLIWAGDSHASWKILESPGFISRTWKVLESEFGPGKSWNLPVVKLNQHAFYV